MANFLSDDKIEEMVLEDVRWVRDVRDVRKEDWKRFYKLYKNYVNPVDYPFEANNAIPTAYSVVEVQTAFLLDMIFESGDFVEVLGKTPEGQASASAVRELLNYHFRHSIRSYEEFERFIRQLLIMGTTVFKLVWNYQPGWKTRYIPQYDIDGTEKESKEILNAEILVNAPAGYTVDIDNFGVDPNAYDVNSARFAYEDMYVDPMEVIERYQIGVFKNVDQLVGGESNDVNSGLSDRLEEIGIESFQNSPYVDRNKIHLIDYWGYLSNVSMKERASKRKRAKRQLYHVVLAMHSSNHSGEGRPIILLAEPSPFYHNKIPFIDARINACVGEFYGTGDIEYCESLFHEQRDLRNIFLDNLNLSMNQMYVVRTGSVIDESELVHRPSGIIHAENVDDIVPFRTDTFDPAVFRAQDDIRRDIESATGINDFVMGQYRSSSGFNDTATGISLIQNVALKRLAQKGQVIQRAIRDMGQMLFGLVAQFEPYREVVRILDRENATKVRFIDISSQALKNEYDFNVVSAPALGGKVARQQQMMQLFQLLVSAKQQDPNFNFDLSKFVMRVIDEMDIPNPQELFGNPQYNQPMPNSLGQPEQMEELLAPEEENRIITETRQPLQPSIRDHHPHHMVVHMEYYDQPGLDQQIKSLLEIHYDAHARYAEATKELIARNSAIDMQGQVLDMQRQQLGQMQQPGNGKGTKSGDAVSGAMEALIRGQGNSMAGNQ